MPRPTSFFPFFLVSSVAVVLAACATPADPPAPGHGRATSDACAAHRQARSDEERRAAAEAHIVQMHGQADDGHVERHLRMMELRCSG